MQEQIEYQLEGEESTGDQEKERSDFEQHYLSNVRKFEETMALLPTTATSVNASHANNVNNVDLSLYAQVRLPK